MSPSTEPEPIKSESVEVSAVEPEITLADVWALEQDNAAKLAAILTIMEDLQTKVQTGAAAIPAVLEKLYNLPILGGALRNMFSE